MEVAAAAGMPGDAQKKAPSPGGTIEVFGEADE
jgi:hypothetical protein